MTTGPSPGGHGTGARRGPYQSGLRRRRQIVETAVQVFGQHGYAGGSLRQIAEIVGVSTPALIRHFGSKENLFAAVLEHSDRANSETTLQDLHGLEHLRRFAGMVSTNVRNRGMVELLLTMATEASNPEHPARPFIAERYRRVVTGLTAELGRAVEAGEIRRLSEAELEAEARGLAALMDGLELQWLLDPTVDLVSLYGYHFEQMVLRWRSGTDATDGSPTT